MTFPINTVYSVFSFIGFVLCMMPLSWHLQAWNIGTCAFMLWTGFGCLNYFINSVIWNGRLDNVAPVWCDISVHYIMALGAAIPACSLCINRRLYHIATSTTVNKTTTDRRREISIDLSLCLGVPILSMIADYIVQGNRFDIYEDYGCNPVIYDTWVALVIYNLPAIVIGLISAIYCLLSIRAFKHRRAQFNSLLSAHSTHLDSRRYFRLMAIAGVDVAFTVPTASLVLYLNAQPGLLSPWLGWEDTHFGFEQVNVFPAVLWRQSGVAATALELTRWFMPFTAVVFFAVFGLTQDARRRYMKLFGVVKTKLGASSFQSSTRLVRSAIKSVHCLTMK
ncbi:fungal pheromone STE3G-protein-coupled receptor [Mucidula mucida]|nr:fungal pheromone STE3G-protein-coupled receptor [Mucidula mucida]